MTNFSDAIKDKLNKSNRAMQDASGGTLLQKISDSFATGVLEVTEAQINASAISLDTGQSGATGFVVQRYLSGSQVSDIYVELSGGVLGIFPSTGSPLATGDVIHWMVM